MAKTLEEYTLETCLSAAGVTEKSLAPNLDYRSFFQLALTNKNIYTLFTDRENSQRNALLDTLMAYCAHIIVNDPTNENIEKLKKLLEKYPELLIRKINKVVFEETGQAYINYSLLQLAYAEYDDGLCSEVFEPCFIQAAQGNEEAARKEIRRQLDEKFPEESDGEKQKNEAEEKSLLMSLLTPAKQAITNEQFNNGRDEDKKLILSQTTHTHVTSFREAFDALQPKEIDKGRRFSLSTAQIIYDDLAQAYPQWGYNYDRFALYDDGLISRMQRYKPKNIKMSGAQGLYYLQDNSEIFERDTTLRFDAATSKGGKVEGPRINFDDCLKRDSLDFSGLGGSSVNIVYGASAAAALAALATGFFQNSCRTKTSNLQNLRGETKRVRRLGQ